MKIAFPKIGSKCVSYFGHLGLSLTSNAPLTLSEWTYCPSNDQPPSPSDFTVATEETNSDWTCLKVPSTVALSKGEGCGGLTAVLFGNVKVFESTFPELRSKKPAFDA
ncbi:Outward-rectifier potassium channel TOK1 [Fusarium oxysporum f. sp. albedinis]|nr:Outward-rectifier potassium channel TOK1 [Fusarium oxysporum f. sp. albedinis]